MASSSSGFVDVATSGPGASTQTPVIRYRPFPAPVGATMPVWSSNVSTTGSPAPCSNPSSDPTWFSGAVSGSKPRATDARRIHAAFFRARASPADICAASADANPNGLSRCRPIHQRRTSSTPTTPSTTRTAHTANAVPSAGYFAPNDNGFAVMMPRSVTPIPATGTPAVITNARCHSRNRPPMVQPTTSHAHCRGFSSGNRCLARPISTSEPLPMLLSLHW